MEIKDKLKRFPHEISVTDSDSIYELYEIYHAVMQIVEREGREYMADANRDYHEIIHINVDLTYNDEYIRVGCRDNITKETLYSSLVLRDAILNDPKEPFGPVKDALDKMWQVIYVSKVIPYIGQIQSEDDSERFWKNVE